MRFILISILLLLNEPARAKPDLAEALRELGNHSTMALTFAGFKPFSSTAPPTGYTAESLLSEIRKAPVF